MSKIGKFFKKRPWFIFFIGGLLGVIVVLFSNKMMYYTSTDEYCESCHVHTHVYDSWKLSTHYNNESGVRVHCVDCHLPPKGSFNHFKEKARTGLHDLWAYWTKDSADFNWEQKSQLEYAVNIVYNESCKECHVNLFPKGLSDDGGTAHLYYEENEKKLNLQCISCHLAVGHYDPNYSHAKLDIIPTVSFADGEKFTEPTTVEEFEDFTEQIPGTAVSFDMVAIPGGTYKMGSPEKEKYRRDDEGPVREVTVDPFFMGKVEVTWNEYWSFHIATASEGRIPPEVMKERNREAMTPDAISGPTPPFGNPEQGWGGGARPAITMTHYSAEIYCQWLSGVTGKKYRLPTEAEWEYAARGGTETPYFFEGAPKKFTSQGWWRKISSPDTTMINRFVIYALNSDMKTQEPFKVKENPFGLKNMLGNVLEYCSDWYAPDAYTQTGLSVTNPKGPEEGTEYVVRGGNYADDAADVRAAVRGVTQTEEWLKTDPQQPKSIWWYSDIKGIGFRVVCEPDSTIISK
ncbi:MAG: SUMF1/EgtB/PvdO family nonheme iron enzyme [Bacteroidales bacterium]|jgi:cytochrome c nitrite reductase small subunit|nr:SUMF1/EgtB/PvdO family nonheme iron enzyme [Bacteroidales bacterium]